MVLYILYSSLFIRCRIALTFTSWTLITHLIPLKVVERRRQMAHWFFVEVLFGMVISWRRRRMRCRAGWIQHVFNVLEGAVTASHLVKLYRIFRCLAHFSRYRRNRTPVLSGAVVQYVILRRAATILPPHRNVYQRVSSGNQRIRRLPQTGCRCCFMRRVDNIDTFPSIHMLNGQLCATAFLKLRPVHRQRIRIFVGPDRGPLLLEGVRGRGPLLLEGVR